MNWLGLAICGVTGWVLQTTINPWVAIGGVRPDWMVVFVVFFGLYAPRREAYVACWVLGLGVDLLSVERLGVFALTYCLVAIGVSAVRDMVFLKNAGTHFVVTLTAGALAQVVFATYLVLVYPALAADATRVYLNGLLTAVYTAAWAPPIHHLLLKCSGLLGLTMSRRFHRRIVRTGVSRV